MNKVKELAGRKLTKAVRGLFADMRNASPVARRYVKRATNRAIRRSSRVPN